MLRNATVAALALCAGLPMTATAQQPCEHEHEDTCFHGIGVGCGKAAMMSQRLAAGQTQEDEGLQALAEAFSATDLLHANIDLEIFPATVTLSGTCTLTVKALQPISEFTFRLRNNFTITSSTVNGATPVTVANPSTTTRIATLDRVYAANETFTLTIVYNGPAVSRGFGSIEFQTTPFGDPIIATLSEAFYAYTWWPAKDADVGQPGDMSDKATFQLAITAPDNLTSVANGMLQGVDVLSGARKRYRWSTTYPQAVYLAAFGSSVYDHYTIPWTIPGGGGATMPYDVYIYPGDNNAFNRAQWDLSLPALDVFSNLFGMYPFVNEKYGIYQFPFSGGMEHQTMTGMGVFLDFVTVHELAHQWWGDDVTCKTWNDIWLNEGFATYCEALWEEFKPGSSGTPALHAAMAGRRPGAISGSVYRYDTSSNNPIFSGTYSYRKGGWVLHMLRHVLGDAQFFGALNAYRAQFTGSAATTEDFKNSVEASTGKELDTFFQQWVYAGGAPGYAAGFQPITVNGKHYAKVRLRQTQTDVNFGVGGLFVMPVDLRLDTGAGSVTRTVNDDAMSDHFVLAAPAPVTGLTVDEFNWILATEKLSEAYVPGPPVVVETIPAPGSTVAFASSPTFVDVFFSENVTAPSGAFTVNGPSGSVPFTHAYSAGLQRSRLTFAAALPAGTYTVTIGPAVTTAAGALDGEVVAATLPSGDGAAGGNAVITFTIDPPACAADFNQDGNLDPDDLGDYINCYFTVPPCDQADFNGDTNTDPDDLGDFINAYFAGCA